MHLHSLMDIYLHLLKNVKEDIKKLGKQQNNLAKNIGISSENLSYCLANQVRFKFTIFEKLLKEIYEDQYSIYEDHLIQFIESTPRLENIRECLEWCCNHCELELFEVALERAIKDKKMKETAEIYKLINDRRSGGDIIRIFDHVEDFRIRTKSKENITLLSLLSLNILEDLNKFSAISLYARQAKRNIEALKSGYIKDSYYVRLKEIELLTYMKEGNVDNAIIEGEKFIKEVNDQDFPFSVNYARIILAQSYLFKSTIIATKYSNEALDLIKNDKHNRYVNRRKALKATYDFINIVAGNYENLFLEDNSEKAHFFAKVGRKEEALEILKKLEMEKGRLSPFQLYYRAIATNCIKDYEKAKEEFVKNGDFHFIKLFF